MEENEILDTEACDIPIGTPTEETDEPYRVFKTQGEFQECIDRALGKRLAKARQTDEELLKLKEVCKSVCEKQNVNALEELCTKDTQSDTLSAEVCEQINELCTQTEFLNGQAESLLADGRFKALVKSGFSLYDAAKNVLIDKYVESETEKARAEVISEIRKRGLRPSEDAVSGYGSFSAALDPRNLTDEQREEIRERVRRGERVTF